MSSKKVLIVDNNINSSELISEKLKRKGYLVTIATSGNNAIDLFDDNFFDIVISELEMKDGDGFKLLEYSNAQMNKPRFYFLSKFPENRSIVDCIKAGAIDFFLKPMDIDELISKIDP
jgi:DNA-binding response OmpR family regulator